MKFRYLLPALGISGGIIWISSLPANALLGDSTLFKRMLTNFAHIPAYTMLSFFWLMTFNTKKIGKRFFSLVTPILAGLFLFSVSDEFHQSFVSNRTASGMDISLDMIGILLGFYLLRVVNKNRGTVK